jgi:hypothetical protein
VQVAIGMPIGYPSGSGKAAGVFDYLLNDTFTTDRAAGAVNGTNAEPGPGVRSVTDDNSKMSLSGGQLVVTTGGVGVANPQLLCGPVSRAPGRLVVAQLVPTTETFAIGFDAATASPVTAGAAAFGIRFAGSSRTLQIYSSALPLSVGNWAAATTYQIAVVAQATGAFYFIKGGAFTNWVLLWRGTLGAFGASALLYPAAVSDSSTAVYTADYIRVPAALWLPTPLISDGFSAWGTSDGLGHAEGVAGGLGSGGSGDAWTDAVGTWGASAGVAVATALSAGRAIATVDCGKADMLISANMVVPSATLSIVVRWTDENNFVMLRRTPTNLQLVKTVAGVTTTVSDNASTYVAGAEVRLICEGTKFRMFYNNAAISTEQTIADAAVQTATAVGLRSGDVACTADNFVVYARGSGGEHSALDAF